MTSKRIKLRKNQSSFPLETFQETGLTSLDIISEGLEGLPTEGWSNLENLQNLSIQCANVSEIPSAIFELPKLNILKIKNGRVSSLPNCTPTKNIQSLQLNNNKITELPHWMGELYFLEVLDISGNQLTKLPDSFSMLQNLKRINMDRNNFEVLPEELLDLKGLLHLSLDNNPWKEEEKDKIYKKFNIWFG